MKLPKLRWFGNDSDGLTLEDAIHFSVFVFWVYVGVRTLVQSITPDTVDFFEVVTWVMLSVVGGRAIQRFPTRSRYAQKNPYEMSHMGYSGYGYGGMEYGYPAAQPTDLAGEDLSGESEVK